MSIKRKTLNVQRDSPFQFPLMRDMVLCWVRRYYPEKAVVFFDNCKTHFDSLPNLIILKRDDFNTYLNGVSSEFCVVVFESLQEAQDFSYTLKDASFIVICNGEITYQWPKGVKAATRKE